MVTDKNPSWQFSLLFQDPKCLHNSSALCASSLCPSLLLCMPKTFMVYTGQLSVNSILWISVQIINSFRRQNKVIFPLLPPPPRKRETLYNPIPCAISCSFSSTQKQPHSGISPNKSLLWYFWWSLALWYYLASDCHNTFPSELSQLLIKNLSPPNFTICIQQTSHQRSHISFGKVFPSEMQHLW